MYKILFPILTLSMLSYGAQMKCEAGKCSSGEDSTQMTKVPQKSPVQSTTHLEETKARHNKPTIEQLFNVRTVMVEERYTAKEQVNYGYIVAQESRKTDVTSWFSGYVEKLYVDTLYKQVEKGDALALVYSPEVYKAKQDYLNAIKFNAKRAAMNMVQSAKNKLVLLGVSRVEIRALAKKHTLSKYTTIYAPTSGWIFAKNIQQGSYIDSKKSLYTIVNLDKVWLEAKLFQEQLPELETLTRFNVKVKGIAKMFKATKELLYPVLERKEATATLRLSIENKEGLLRPGMYAKLHARTVKKVALLIPRTAVIRKNGQWYAFLATEFKGEYEPIKISIKPIDTKQYEVLSGLNAGDKVVNNALFMMDSDAQINSIY